MLHFQKPYLVFYTLKIGEVFYCYIVWCHFLQLVWHVLYWRSTDPGKIHLSVCHWHVQRRHFHNNAFHRSYWSWYFFLAIHLCTDCCNTVCHGLSDGWVLPLAWLSKELSGVANLPFKFFHTGDFIFVLHHNPRVH